MPAFNNQISMSLNLKKFQEYWQKIKTLLENNYYESFPHLKNHFELWIHKAFNEGPNIYEEFIKFRRENPKISKLDQNNLEIHHILCKFDGGKDDDQNKIELDANNHILAHIIRFITLKKPGDFMASLLRLCSNTEISLSERGKIIANLNKDRKILFWSSKWQSIQGKKRGPKGGFANTLEQFKARSKVGKTFGEKNGLLRQTNETLEWLKETFYFRHENNRNQVYKFVPAFQSFAEIMDVLDKLALSSSGKEIEVRSTFYKVFCREKYRMYGWELLEPSTNKQEIAKDSIILNIPLRKKDGKYQFSEKIFNNIIEICSNKKN